MRETLGRFVSRAQQYGHLCVASPFDACAWSRMGDGIVCRLFVEEFAGCEATEWNLHHANLRRAIHDITRSVVRRPEVMWENFWQRGWTVGGDLHGNLQRLFSRSLGGLAWWSYRRPMVLDPQQTELSAVHCGVLFSIQITEDPVASHAWDGHWPLPTRRGVGRRVSARHNAVYAVYIRVNPSAYRRGGRRRNPGPQRRLRLVRRKLNALLCSVDARRASGWFTTTRRTMEVHRMFYDDDEEHVDDDPTETIVYRPPHEWV